MECDQWQREHVVLDVRDRKIVFSKLFLVSPVPLSINVSSFGSVSLRFSPFLLANTCHRVSCSSSLSKLISSYLYKTSWTSDVFLLSFRIRKSYRCLTNNCISLNGNVVVSPLYFQLAREFRFIAVETWSVVYVRICDSASSSRKISSNTIVSLNDWISRKGDSVTACINIDHSVSWREAVPILLI